MFSLFRYMQRNFLNFECIRVVLGAQGKSKGGSVAQDPTEAMPEPEEEEDEEVNPEDEQFFKDNERYSGFLTDLSLSAPVSGVISSKSDRQASQKEATKLRQQKRAEREQLRGRHSDSSDKEDDGDEYGDDSDDDEEDDGATRRIEQRGGRLAGWQEEEDDGAAARKVGLPVKLPDGRVTYTSHEPSRPALNDPRSLKKPRLPRANEHDEDPDGGDEPWVPEEGAPSGGKAVGGGSRDEGNQSGGGSEGGGSDAGGSEGGGSVAGGSDDDEDGWDEDEALELSGAAAGPGAGSGSGGAEALQRSLEARVAGKKRDMAALCESILESPEEGLSANPDHPRGLTKLAELFEMARTDADAGVRALATLSEMAVLRDLIPGYRIRLPTAAEKAVQVSREVRQLRDYEASLLAHYQAYLKFLEKSVILGTGRWAKDFEREAATTALRCLGELLVGAPHFNFRANVLKVLCAKAGAALPGAREASCDALRRLFAADQQGDVTLEGVRLVARAVKDSKYPHPADAVRTFLVLHLEVKEETVSEAALRRQEQKEKKHRQKFNEKRALEANADKSQDEVEASMREADAGVDKALREHCMKESLKEVVVTYFRVLKHATDAAVDQAGPLGRGLLPAALEGLAHFAHLVNLDTVEDLLVELKLLLTSSVTAHAAAGAAGAAGSGALPLEASLNCVRTALRTLHGGGGAVAKFGRELGSQVDEGVFLSALFALLPRLASERGGDKCALLAVECVEHVLLRRKEYSLVRTGAFVHRLLVVALQLSDCTAAASLVATARAVVCRYPAVQQLLEGDEDRTVTGGEFRPLGPSPAAGEGAASGGAVEGDFPELSNPLSAAAWELSLLRHHWHPSVGAQAAAAAGASAAGPNEGPVQVYGGLAQAGGLFYPPWRLPTPSPLHALVKKQMAQQPRYRRPVFLRLVDPDAPPRHVAPEEGTAAADAGGAVSHAGGGPSGRPFAKLFRDAERFRLDRALRRAEVHARRLASEKALWEEAMEERALEEARMEKEAAAAAVATKKTGRKAASMHGEAPDPQERKKKKKTAKPSL